MKLLPPAPPLRRSFLAKGPCKMSKMGKMAKTLPVKQATGDMRVEWEWVACCCQASSAADDGSAPVAKPNSNPEADFVCDWPVSFGPP